MNRENYRGPGISLSSGQFSTSSTKAEGSKVGCDLANSSRSAEQALGHRREVRRISAKATEYFVGVLHPKE
jgi:hypothetical protein